MHGHSPGYTGYIVSVNVKLESMGRLVDGHVGLDAKTSPRQAVIEKAQAELRKEFHVRERRRRELEFLEKGGNLLDFRYASAATVGVQSTSLTDQLHEHEEKGSLALASSMQGDSNPCSEQPSAPSARESKIADNLVLDDENSTFNRGKNVKHLGKRKTTILLETASKTGEDYNINKSEENVILHLSMKSQAYARRNRSQSSCDIAHITSTEAVPSYHADQPSLPTFQPSTSGANVSPSAICNSKTASSYENSASKPIVSEDHLGLELDPVLPHEEPMDETGEPKETSEITTNKLQGSAGIEQRSQIAVEQYGNGVPPTSCGTIMLREENSLDSHTQGLNEMVIHPESSNKSKFSGSCNAAKDLNNIDKNSEKYYNNTGTSISISYILEAEHSSAKISHDIDDSATGACHLSVVPDGGYNRDFGKQTSISEPALLLASAALRENREISSVDVNVNDRATVSASNSISQVENKNLFDERTDRLAGTASTAHLKNTITDNETCLKAEAEMDDSSHYAYIASNKTTTSRAIKSDVMLLPNQMFLDQSFSVHDSEPAFEIQSVSADDSKLVDEVHEDLILKEAQIIEAKLKKAGELPHNFRIEKHRRSHWDYVLEEMTWLANDFMQERLWKITAAAQICHNIALNGHSKFHERIHCRKVKVLARTLGDAVMSFWQSAEENKVSHEENPERLLKLPVYRYAVHFLKSDSSSNHLTQAEAPRTPERMFDLVSQGIPWEVHFSEESMHYKVPDGSMQVYRESMEAYWLHHEKDHLKKRSENYHFGSNGSGGLNIHQAAKNPKLVKHVPEKSSEADPAYGPIPSPDTSQMSIMSNSNKLLKVIQRDRGRRNKSLKVTAGQSGTGTPWSLFEDQALVVLVHDMGPNWELISDAMNGTLQFKCIHRKPMDCKERHKFLMDISDGADSAEDSGSSQPYPSTLPGIPKGSARQLFQYLQGPLDEDTLKSHFEKIIHIGQNIHSRKIKKGNHNSKQVSVVHSSHVQAFSEACPNNLSGAPLTPIDLCDTIASSSDNTALQCQGPHINGSALSDHQGHSAPILPSSGANTVIQGSPGTVMGGSQSSPPAALSAPTRNVQRYGMPRPSSSPVDDQQTMQQFDQTLTSRNVHGTLPVGPDRNLRMLPRGNGMGMMGGVNRGVHMSRPGFQGVGSPAMLNMVSSGSMTSCTGVGIPGQVNIHSRSISSQGNSLVRPRDGLQMLGSGKNSEDHRQTIKQEIQMHGKQGNGQPTSSFNAMRAPLSSQPISQPGQSFSVLQQQQPQRMPQQPYVLGIPQHAQVQGSNHSMPQQQAYAMRVAQERQVQQRLLHQQEVSGSNAMSTMQNSPQIQKPLQSSTTPVSAPNPQQKSNASHNPQSSATLPNQIMKQRQRQQLLQQQLPRQQTQLPQQVQQHANLLKGAGRGSVSMDQSSPIETSHVNGPFPGNQVLEKHMMQQSKTSYPQNLGSNATLLPSNQQKKFPRPLLQSAKQMPTTSSHPNGSNQGNQVLVSQPLLASQQQSSPSNQSQKQTNQSHQKMFRVMLHQNCQLSSDNSKQAEPIQIHQNPAVQTIPHCTDSVGLIPDSTSASSSQWKSEPSFDGSVRTPSNQVFYSPQSSLTATESLVASASQGLMQRQFSGTILVHGQSTVDGSSWPHQKPSQQQPPPAQQQQQPPIQLQQLHRNVGQGAFYGRSTNNGPG